MLLNALSEKFQGVFKKMRGYGKITEANIGDALREIRMALLSADVNYQVAKDFCERIKTKALGTEVQGSIRPGDLFVKIIHDELLSLFNEGTHELNSSRPLRILLCGLNGAGKTTSAGKLALYFRRQQKEKVLLVAADLARPAAIQQLQTLGKQIDVPVFAPSPGANVVDHVRQAEEEARRQDARVIIYDTAGRLEIDEALLRELASVVEVIKPQECLLVADAATGQNATEVAKAFQNTAPLTGIILSKFDGDAKGGAALSLQSITHCPIKFLGTGEQLNAFEIFDPERLVGRMLGMGDIVGLVEKAQQEISEKDASSMLHKMQTNTFTLQDFLSTVKEQKWKPWRRLLKILVL